MKRSGINAIGRRKSSVARVWVRPGSGKIEVNEKECDQFFGRASHRILVRQPLVVLGKLEKYDVKANVCGGGTSGQAGAIRLGIARALVEMDPEARKALRAEGLLTRDPRAVERKKYGRHGARRRPQFSKR